MVDMWRIVRGYRKKEQVIIVLLQSLNENKKVEKAVSKLKVTDLMLMILINGLLHLTRPSELRKPKSRMMYMMNLISFFALKI